MLMARKVGPRNIPRRPHGSAHKSIHLSGQISSSVAKDVETLPDLLEKLEVSP